jgi:hypothetical protein
MDMPLQDEFAPPDDDDNGGPPADDEDPFGAVGITAPRDEDVSSPSIWLIGLIQLVE